LRRRTVSFAAFKQAAFAGDGQCERWERAGVTIFPAS
jgi:hypothetical protein